MAHLHFGPRPFEADLVVFDKDGTLIDFGNVWEHYIINAVEAQLAALGNDPHARTATDPLHFDNLRADLYATLGYDPATRIFDAQSPVVTAPISVLNTLVAGVLYRHGWGWLAAEIAVQRAFGPTMSAPLPRELITPTADLPALFGALIDVGVQIAVVTADDREPTLAALTWQGVIDHIAFIACADDGRPHKPAPDALLAACAATGVPVARTVMVGDSTTDMLMAQRAGVGLRVAVLTGTMDEATLAPLADVVLPSIAEIRVAN